MSSGRLRIAVGVLLAGLVVAVVFARSENLRWKDDRDTAPYAGDFIHEYSAAWILREDPTRLYALQTVHSVQHDRARMGFEWDSDSVNVPYYPPPYYALIAPLARLEYRSAANAWIALQLLALAGAVTLLVCAHPVLVRALPWALPLLFVFPPVTTGLVSGQKGPLWLLVFAATYFLLRRHRQFAAGAAFGLLLLKPPLAAVLAAVMLARRQWAFLMGAAATAFGMALLSWGVLGSDTWEVWVRWIESARAPVAQDRPELLAQAHCWLGFVRVALASYSGAGVLLSTALLDLATLAPLLLLVRRGFEPGGGGLPGAFAAVVVATLLVSPHLYTYDLTLLVAVFALAGSELAEDSRVANRQGSWLRRGVLGVFLLATLVTTTRAPVALLASVPMAFVLELLLVRHSLARLRDPGPF